MSGQPADVFGEAMAKALATLMQGEQEEVMARLYSPPVATVTALLDEIRDRKEAGLWDGELGKLVEQLACVCFGSLKGWSSVKSIQTAGPQHDLLISGGSHPYWLFLLNHLHLGTQARTIVVECKGTEDKADDQVAERLASILTVYLDTSGAVGVIFSVSGATGEVEAGKHRQRVLRDSRLTRTLLFARTKKPIIVIDWEAMKTLATPGSLPQILERGVIDLEQMPGLSVPAQNFVEIDLPPYLKAVLPPPSPP